MQVANRTQTPDSRVDIRICPLSLDANRSNKCRKPVVIGAGDEAHESTGRRRLDNRSGGPHRVGIVDVLMPVMDGLEATRMICSMRSGTNPGPRIIGMSAYGDQVMKDQGNEAGMDGILTKPVRPDNPFAIIEREMVSQTP